MKQLLRWSSIIITGLAVAILHKNGVDIGLAFVMVAIPSFFNYLDGLYRKY